VERGPGTPREEVPRLGYSLLRERRGPRLGCCPWDRYEDHPEPADRFGNRRTMSLDRWDPDAPIMEQVSKGPPIAPYPNPQIHEIGQHRGVINLGCRLALTISPKPPCDSRTDVALILNNYERHFVRLLVGAIGSALAEARSQCQVRLSHSRDPLPLRRPTFLFSTSRFRSPSTSSIRS
jgi:hypothetical protein